MLRGSGVEDTDTPKLNVIGTFWKVWCKTNFVQVIDEYSYGQLYPCTYAQGSPVEVQSLIHWNPNGHSVTAPSPVLFPSSILWPHLSHCAFISTRKNWM